MSGDVRANCAAAALAARLAPAGSPQAGHPQSLSRGAAGVALLHAERAVSGLDSWAVAHTWLAAAARGRLDGSATASLFFGVPAVAFALHGAARPGRYERALAALDARLATIVQRRLAAAHARIDRGQRPALAEFDLVHGLTGLGAHLLRRDPHSDLLGQVLAYLVRLTQPLPDGLPGWWTDQAPTGRRATGAPGGHGNLGLAHGVTGILALVSLAQVRGVAVPGQAEAIGQIIAWLDQWRQDSEYGPWWPETVTLDELRHLRPRQVRPGRPSRCYGTPGLAHAQHLAGVAIADPARQAVAVQAMIGCLTDPDQLRQIVDHSLCHGWAGVYQTAWRMTANGAAEVGAHLPGLVDRLLCAVPDRDIGALEGTAGLALALTTAATDQPPATGWDAFLLLA